MMPPITVPIDPLVVADVLAENPDTPWIGSNIALVRRLLASIGTIYGLEVTPSRVGWARQQWRLVLEGYDSSAVREYLAGLPEKGATLPHPLSVASNLPPVTDEERAAIAELLDEDFDSYRRTYPNGINFALLVMEWPELLMP